MCFLPSRETAVLDGAGVLVEAPGVFQHVNRTRCLLPKTRPVAANALYAARVFNYVGGTVLCDWGLKAS